MKPKKKIIVLGDIELGGGTITDDFISDKALSQLILSLAKENKEIELVLNGDVFDFLLCPLIRSGKQYYERHITADVSLEKLDMILKSHKPVIEALSRFIDDPRHKIVLTFGNHDHDLVFKEVQQKIKQTLGSNEQVVFSGLRYKTDGVYIEHGHQYDPTFRIEESRLTDIYKGKEILRLPMGAYGIMYDLMALKKKYSFSERMHPRPFVLRKRLVFLSMYKMASFLFRYSFYLPLRHPNDPTYRFPSDLWMAFWDKMKKYKWHITQYISVDDVTANFKRGKEPSKASESVYILGHTHEKMQSSKDGKIYINPGGWADD
ncbi:MAG: metallophosphoesterase, partial [Candidatus Paceibacterota bacterium]